MYTLANLNIWSTASTVILSVFEDKFGCLYLNMG